MGNQSIPCVHAVKHKFSTPLHVPNEVPRFPITDVHKEVTALHQPNFNFNFKFGLRKGSRGKPSSHAKTYPPNGSRF